MFTVIDKVQDSGKNNFCLYPQRDKFRILLLLSVIFLYSFLKVIDIQGKWKNSFWSCYIREEIKEKNTTFPFSDINPYCRYYEWKNTDSQKCGWLPCMEKVNRLKRWWRELPQEDMEDISVRKKFKRNWFLLIIWELRNN